MVGHGGSSAGSYLADPTSPIPSHCASIVATNTVRVNRLLIYVTHCFLVLDWSWYWRCWRCGHMAGRWERVGRRSHGRPLMAGWDGTEGEKTARAGAQDLRTSEKKSREGDDEKGTWRWEWTIHCSEIIMIGKCRKIGHQIFSYSTPLMDYQINVNEIERELTWSEHKRWGMHSRSKVLMLVMT